MNKSLLKWGIIGLILIILFGTMISTYNGIVDKDEHVSETWSNVEDRYQRRSDLIPNLVNTVKGYASHEKETLQAVIDARSKATSTTIDAGNLNSESINNFMKAQEGLSSALSRLMVVVERYPDLKANQNFLDLQAQLEGTENRISVARQKFNEATKDYNSKIRKFPGSIFAGIFGFEKKDYFQSQEGAEVAPTVEF